MSYKYLSENVKIKTVEETDQKGEFHIEGLYRGYGMTVGNSLRRALLSSLPGAAISQVKVKGVKHEFSTIPGMMEDVVNFKVNLKKIRFNFEADEPQVLKLKAKGKKEVTAGDIESTALVEVINKDLKIATLTNKKAELDMEITVEKGLGYVPAEDRKDERLPIGTIMLDCVYSPVKNVRFSVENMRVGERTDYNRVKMIIETDGSIKPSAAVHKASNILKDHFDKISKIYESPEEKEEKKSKKDKEKEKKKEDKEEKKEDEKKSSKEDKFICDVCGFEAKSERGLKSHKTRQHS